jgi:hypothetical protein
VHTAVDIFKEIQTGEEEQDRDAEIY